VSTLAGESPFRHDQIVTSPYNRLRAEGAKRSRLAVRISHRVGSERMVAHSEVIAEPSLPDRKDRRAMSRG